MKVHHRKSRAKLNNSLTSMGDIAFLLIIFFIVTSNFIKESRIELEEASSLDVEELELEAISVAVDKEGDIFLDGEEIEGGPEELGNMVKNLVADKDEDDKKVMVKIDKNLAHASGYKKIFMQLAEAGVKLHLVGELE